MNEGVVYVLSYTGHCVGAAYYAVHVGAAQVVAREGAAVSEESYLLA